MHCSLVLLIPPPPPQGTSSVISVVLGVLDLCPIEWRVKCRAWKEWPLWTLVAMNWRQPWISLHKAKPDLVLKGFDDRQWATHLQTSINYKMIGDSSSLLTTFLCFFAHWSVGQLVIESVSENDNNHKGSWAVDVPIECVNGDMMAHKTDGSCLETDLICSL